MKFFKQLWDYRGAILDLSVDDWKREYTETMFGVFWAIFKPVVMVFTFWYVFVVAFGGGDSVDGIPFIVWLLAGIVPWFFLSESLGKGATSLTNYSVLITTIKFPVMSLPIIQIVSRLYTHIVVLLFMFLIFLGNGYFPSIYWLNIFYFMFCGVVLMIAINFILSSLGVLMKDISQVIQAIMMPLYWFTPIIYPIDNLSPMMQFVMRLVNPFNYIIEGYRDSLLYNTWFWENWRYDLYFWVLVLILLAIGIKLQKTLRPIMADLI